MKLPNVIFIQLYVSSNKRMHNIFCLTRLFANLESKIFGLYNFEFSLGEHFSTIKLVVSQSCYTTFSVRLKGGCVCMASPFQKLSDNRKDKCFGKKQVKDKKHILKR